MSVESAIQAKLTADTGPGSLVALAAGGIWQGSPPQGQGRPYLLWQFVAGRPTEHTLRAKVSDDVLVQFYAWAEDTAEVEGVATAREIMDRLEVVMFDAALTIDGRTHLYCRKDTDLPYLEDTESGGEKAYGKGQQWLLMVQ